MVLFSVNSWFNNHKHYCVVFLIIPIVLSAYTHIWNPLGFRTLVYDEGTYIGRAMHVLDGLGFQTEPFYDHPYFGQLFLAGVFKIIGYPDLLHTSENLTTHTIEELWLVPRVIMGMLSVVDTILVYLVSKIYYNRKVALVASILFAVTPISTRFLPIAFLDSIQLPFLLLSILCAVYLTKISENTNKNNEKAKASMIILSGIFLGLAIFTKMPAFTMIPLVAFLIFTSTSKNSSISLLHFNKYNSTNANTTTSNNPKSKIKIQNLKMLGLWFVPVILIPAIWPAYSISVNQFGEWYHGIFYQTHRQGEGDKTLLNTIISTILKTDAILMLLGIAGFIFAALRKDLFILLWGVPFLIFFYFIAFVRDFHLIPLIPVLCISSAKLIIELSNKMPRKYHQILPIAIISGIGIYQLITISMVMITANNNNDAFQMATFLSQYLKYRHNIMESNAIDHYNNNNKMTVISNHVYSWIPKYVLHLLGYNYRIPEIEANEVPSINEKVVLVADNVFKRTMSADDDTGKRLQKVYNLHSKNGTTIIGIGRYRDNNKIILPEHWPSYSLMQNQRERPEEINLIDQSHVWKANKNANILQKNGSLSITVPMNKTDNEASNQAVLHTRLDSTKKPVTLSLDYKVMSSSSSSSSSFKGGKAAFTLEIRDMKSKNLEFVRRLAASSSTGLKNNLFILPDNIIGKPIELRISIASGVPRGYTINVSKANAIEAS